LVKSNDQSESLTMPETQTISASEFKARCLEFLDRLADRTLERGAPFNPDIAIASSWLPGEIHGDPADRLIIATARHLGLPIVTRDRKILAYADAGEVSAMLC
jgi:PIN domain nuclease of toxin-antitoxin system